MSIPSPQTSSSKLWRLMWLAILAAHATVAAGGWWMLPGGSPISHLRFWANSVIPIAAFAYFLFVRFYGWRRPHLLPAMLVFIPAFWASVAIIARILFPVSASFRWLVVLAVAAILFATLWRGLRETSRSNWKLRIACFNAAIALAMILMIAQMGPLASTRPINVAISESIDALTQSRQPGITLADGVRVNPVDGQVVVQQRRTILYIEPLLTFISRSPDRCWTLFAPRQFRVRTQRRLAGLAHATSSVLMSFRDDGDTRLRVDSNAAAKTADIEAITNLSSPIYSHLNTFCEISLSGQRKLSIVFSPCPDVPIEVRSMEYPFGKPARFAYLDESGNFNVVEASSAEKGPFTTLARGPLKRGEPLALTLLDQGKAIYRITLDDWSTQASTDLSPTAGWRVPQNAIEFSLANDQSTAPASIFITLAATSVGRGFDSVGHAAGTYRNRIHIESLESTEPEKP